MRELNTSLYNFSYVEKTHFKKDLRNSTSMQRKHYTDIFQIIILRGDCPEFSLLFHLGETLLGNPNSTKIYT